MSDDGAVTLGGKSNMTLVLIFVVIAVIILWALLEPYLLKVEQHTVSLPHLPESWVGQRVALISDLHVGMWLANTATIRMAVERIVQERPALVLIAGDFVHHDGERTLEEVTTLLRPLTEAGLRCYGVLGNHDYDMPTEDDKKNRTLVRDLTLRLESIGIRVLHNAVVALELPNSRDLLYLVGLAAHTRDKDVPRATLANVPEGAARIVLMHHPSSFAALPAHRAPLVVAGHTHGGQIRLPGAPIWRYLEKRRKDEVLTNGWIKNYGAEGNHLYVKGIGFSVAPVRLNCPPELTFFSLTGAEKSVSRGLNTSAPSREGLRFSARRTVDTQVSPHPLKTRSS
jgi:uncharacterized protein